MLQTTKLAQITKEMSNYHLDILGLSETRWPGQGKIFLKKEKRTLLYSGPTKSGKHGVGILLSDTANKALIE